MTLPEDRPVVRPRFAVLLRALGPLLIAAATAAMLAWSWRRWPDVLIDFGRELYVPWQLSEGKVLYRDVAYFNGPLSPYFNSLVFRALGVSLSSLILSNLAIVLLVIGLLFRLLTDLADRFSATIACLTFVTTFAFAQLDPVGNYNFICPYSHEMTHGLFLALLELWFLRRFARLGRLRNLSLAGLALGSLWLTKPELFLAGGLAGATYLGLVLCSQGQDRPLRAGPGATLFVMSLIAPPLAARVFMGLYAGWDTGGMAVLGGWRYVLGSEIPSTYFYRETFGLVNLPANLSMLLRGAGEYALVLLCAFLLSFLVARQPRGRWVTRVAVFGIAVFLLCRTWGLKQAEYFARPLPVLMAVLVVAHAVLLVRRRGDPAAAQCHALWLGLSIFALALLGKILLRARVYDYGFVLAMPAMLLCIVTVLHDVPLVMQRFAGDGRVVRAVMLAVWVAATSWHLGVTQLSYRTKTYALGSGGDQFWVEPGARIVEAALNDLRGRLQPGDTLAVLPEGSMFNYLLRRGNSTPYIQLMPTEVVMFGEDRIVGTMEAHPPDYVVLVHRTTYEHNLPFFGRHYARKLYTWIQSHYRRVRLFGAPPLEDDRFGILVLRRADEGANRQTGTTSTTSTP